MRGGVTDGRTCGWENCGRSLTSHEGERPRDFRRRRYCGQSCAQRDVNTPRGSDRADAFWRLVIRRGPNECWPWGGFCTDRGYGLFTHLGVRKLAHRVAMELTLGHEPGEAVMHSCDNPPCCNPAHLVNGTRSANFRDMWRKGRARPGRRT